MQQIISIFGSTGTVGKKALKSAISSGFEVLLLTGNKNCDLMIEQAKLANPKYICMISSKAFKIVKSALEGSTTEVLPASELQNLCQIKTDCAVMAISGNAGIIPTFSLIGNTKKLAIATKEAIISGGDLLLALAKKNKTEIIPIDSEHNAVFQCLKGEDKKDISKIILTASGGAFLNFEEKDLEHVRPKDALKHPNWNMGKKITIDSATLINKALEIIEAHYLFALDIKKIEALIHPESIIHGMVAFLDGSFKALLASPDMMMPISFAINYPHKSSCDIKNLDFEKISNLTFRSPKSWQRRNIDLAYTAVHEKKVITFNLANEKFVYDFIDGKIKFSDIYTKICSVLETAQKETVNSLNDIIEINQAWNQSTLGT